MVNGNFGGHSLRLDARREYYHSYGWEIISLFETPFRTNSPEICLKDAQLPTFTVNKESYVAASLEYKFAKNVTWDDIKITWYDSVGLLDVISKWRNAVWNEKCGLGKADDYKKNSILRHYLPTGEQEVQWRLINSWPSTIRHGDLTYTSSDVKLVEISLTYDWAVENRPLGSSSTSQVVTLTGS